MSGSGARAMRRLEPDDDRDSASPGGGATGNRKYASAPDSRMATAKSVVATGRLMNRLGMLTVQALTPNQGACA